MIMMLLVGRTPLPDAPYWPGRRFLALLDAVLWPMLILVIVLNVPYDTGIAGRFALALCALCTARRAARALCRNARYRFTTVRLGVPFAALLAMGALLKAVA